MENNNNFCSLQTNIMHYFADKVSVINKIKLELDYFKLSLDPSFIISIIDFVSNIIYRMNLRDFNVDNIFLNPNRIKEDNIFEDYKNKSTLYYGNNISIPSLGISFEMSNIGLDNLVMDYLNYSSFYSWIIKRLTENKYNINISGSEIQKFVGNLYQLIMTILNNYKNSASSKFIKLALKGLINNILKNLGFNDSEHIINNPSILRPPRAFYGKYQYFQNFNLSDANIYKQLFKKKTYFFYNYIKGKKYNYVFTNVSLFIMDFDLKIINTIDYFVILLINREKDEIEILFNQIIDGSDLYIISNEGKEKTDNIYNILIQQQKSNADEILFIN